MLNVRSCLVAVAALSGVTLLGVACGKNGGGKKFTSGPAEDAGPDVEADAEPDAGGEGGANGEGGAAGATSIDDTCVDQDGDGVTTCDGDCNDDDDEIFPGNPDGDICGDGKDNDCDGNADLPRDCCLDEDDDGVTDCDGDCDDNDDEVFPGNPDGDICGDGKDNDCDGNADLPEDCCFDLDDDGVTDCDGDCDDDDPRAVPNNPLGELCGDTIDNDCDGDADPSDVCDDDDGNPLGTYVSSVIGLDPPDGTGTRDNPVRTVLQGIGNAITIGNGQPVFVGEGHYDEKVNLVEGVSLLGGHQCDDTECSWDRDASVYDSAIMNVDNEGVHVDDSVTAVTRLDGFRIVAVSGNPGDGAVIAAVTVEAGTPTLENNRIFGGSVTGGTNRGGTGIRVFGPSNDSGGVQILGNEIQGGDSTGTSSGIALSYYPGYYGIDPPVVIIRGNTVRGGPGNWTRAILAEASGAGTIIQGNEVFAGSVVTTGGTSFGMFISGEVVVDSNHINHDPFQVGICPSPNTNFWCGGIESEGSTSVITNNVVYGMLGPRSVAIFFGDGEVPFGEIVIHSNTLNGLGLFSQQGTSLSAALACRHGNNGTNAVVGRIRNNILSGGQARDRFGMYEQEANDTSKTCVPEAYENNDVFFSTLFGSTDIAHRQWLGGAYSENFLTTVADVNQQAYAANNFSADCMLDSTWHLAQGSACVDQGSATEAPSTDFDGDTRPAGSGHDVGADESE